MGAAIGSFIAQRIFTTAAAKIIGGIVLGAVATKAIG